MRAGQPALRVIAWYPAAAAAAAAAGPLAPYLDPAEQHIQAPAIARNFRWPEAFLADAANQPTHAYIDAPVAAGHFPLVIFSHGYWSYPRQNSALMERLAANGYVALSLAHPGDAADLPGDGGPITTIPYDKAHGPDEGKLHAFWDGPDDAARMAALPGFWSTLQNGRLLTSLARWREDIIALTDAMAHRAVPDDARSIAMAADLHRVAYAGMSFGGSASASACEIDRRCRAAVNLDGFEFDRTLYDHRIRVPLLLLQSDWHLYPNEGPANDRFTGYDYAYERWDHAGKAPFVYRYRLAGIRHMGLTDLALAPRDPVRDTMLGEADGERTTAALDHLVLAFLDRHIAGRRTDIAAVAARYPELERHTAREVRQWHMADDGQ
jgi:predicted dienelactone hydrolase